MCHCINVQFDEKADYGLNMVEITRQKHFHVYTLSQNIALICLLSWVYNKQTGLDIDYSQFVLLLLRLFV